MFSSGVNFVMYYILYVVIIGWVIRHVNNMEEEGAGGADNIVADFNTYEEFLDFQIKPIDLYYLEVSIHTFLWLIIPSLLIFDIRLIKKKCNSAVILTVCVFVCHLFSFYPIYFDFHSARIIFDMSSGFYLWNINKTTAWHL